ncbi:MAG: Zn-dependent hydrolase [Anaerolineae bacterium]|nr:Zn-dependent hydrolase [Anaerolineae bacterium]
MIDTERLLRSIRDLAALGQDQAGGNTRLAYTPPDTEARCWLLDQLAHSGFSVMVDALGDIFALEPGALPDASPLLSGSHIDTVPQGGKYDGALGVLVALEAIRSIMQADPYAGQRHPIALLVTGTEESSRFNLSCMASRLLTGDLDPAVIDSACDADGVTIREALAGAGLPVERLAELRRTPGWFREFIEVHIDQSFDLERAGVPLGVVTGIAAPVRLRVVLEGLAEHSGATPMPPRRDALAGAAEVILAVEHAARSRAERGAVGTVGVINAEPGSINTIPGRVTLGVDLRAAEAALLAELEQEVTQAVYEVASRRALTASIETLSRAVPVTIPEERLTRLEAACEATGAGSIRLVSRAAHDTMYLSQHGPVAMLFVRNPAGISHNPAEAARDEDIVLSARVLAACLLDSAHRP